MSSHYKLLQRAILFRKLATEEDEVTEVDYKNSLSTISTADLDDIYLNVRLFQHKTYFKLEDFLPRIYEICQSSLFMRDDIDWINSNFVTTYDYKKEIIYYVLRRFVNDPEVDMQVNDYLLYEDYMLAADLLRKAQNKIIKTIIDRSKSENWPQQQNDSETVNAIESLLKTSRKFTHTFLFNLAKHLGIDIYKKVKENTRELGSVEDLMKKPKLNVWDMAEILTYNPMPKETMLDLISKADDRAKEYMRGFVYDFGGSYAGYFMLDENMNPINIDYKQIEWPRSRIYPKPLKLLLVSTMPKELKQRWIDMFSDFHVVPQ